LYQSLLCLTLHKAFEGKILTASGHVLHHPLPSIDSSSFCIYMQVLLQHAYGECESIGTAQVELSLLHIMGHVSGWYNIINARYATDHYFLTGSAAPSALILTGTHSFAFDIPDITIFCIYEPSTAKPAPLTLLLTLAVPSSPTV